MKKTMRSILTMMLVFVMLIGLFAPAVGAASDALTKSPASSAGAGSGTTVSGTDWFEVSHGANGISVVLKPDPSLLSGLNFGEIKTVLSALINAVYDVVIDDIKGGIAAGEYGEDVTSVTSAGAFKYAFDSYIDSKDDLGNDRFVGATLDDKYQDFFAKAFDTADTEKTVINAAADYACEMLDLLVKVGIIKKADLPDAAKAEEKIKEALNEHIHLADPSLVAAELDNCVDIVLNKYVAKVAVLDSLKPMELYDVIASILSTSVDFNGVTYNLLSSVAEEGVVFDRDELVDFFNALPTPEILAKTADADMAWEFGITMSAKYLDLPVVNTQFNLSVSVGGDTADELHANCNRVRKLAKLIGDHLDYSVDKDNNISISVIMPEKVDDVLAAALASPAVPDTLKRQYFAIFTTEISEVITNLKNLTFDELVGVLDDIDYESLLDSPSITQYIDLTGYTNEQFVAKIKEEEALIMRAIDLVIDVLEYLPERSKDLTILDLYNTDGSFGYAGTHGLDLEKVFTKVSQKYGTLLASFFGSDFDTFTVDLKLDFVATHRVEYVIDGVVHSAGMLPEGASVAFFGPKGDIVKVISHWIDEDGNTVTSMPREDVRLTPVYTTGIVWDYVDAITYDGNAHAVTLKNLPADYTATYTYKDAQGNVVAAPTNAGTYTATVETKLSGSVVDLGISELTFVISKRTVDFSGVTWGAGALVFNGSEQSVTLTGLPANLPSDAVTYSGNTARIPGTYTATATVNLDTANYIATGFTAPAFSWSIAKGVIDTSGVSVPATYSVAYDGNAHSVPVTIDPAKPLPSFVSVNSPAKVAAGTYNVTITLTVTGADAAYYEALPTFTSTLTITANNKTSFDFRDTAGTILVSVTATGGIPYDYELVVDDVSFAHVGYNLASGEYGKVVVAYDINFERAGILQTVTDDMKVKILIPKPARENTTLQIIFIDEDGGTHQFASERQGDYLVFDVEHFSTYAIVEITDAPVPPVKTDLTWLWILLAVIGALTVVGLVIFFIIRRKRANKPTEPTEPTEGDTPTEPDEPTDGTAPEAVAEDVPAEETEPAPETAPEAPAEEVAEDTPAEVAEETPVEEVVEEAPIEEVAAETTEEVAEAPVEVAEETPVEVVEETPAEVAEETPAEVVEETPAEETPRTPVTVRLAEDDEDGERVGDIDGEVVLVRYRTSYESRYIQAGEELQNYYTAIKNLLLSYQGIKSRTSWNYESFNKGRIQCAKLNIKGSALFVHLALNPADFNINKYHFTDMSDKPKFDKVPMLMKVKSERSFKYTMELIIAMMQVLEIPEGIVQHKDYRMPYESTEELARRGLVKVILPPGMTLDENSNVVKVDVSEHIASHESDESDAPAAEETPIAPVEVAEEPEVAPETPEEVVPEEVEETAEEVPAEVEPEVREEAPIEVATPEVEEIPTEETPEEVTEPEVEEPLEEVVLDAEHVDALLTDEEAESVIEVVHTGKGGKGKLAVVNLDVICANFENGETVDLDALKAKRLVPKNTGRIKVLARGVMTKALTIIADKFSLPAVKMIYLAGGHAEIDD